MGFLSKLGSAIEDNRSFLLDSNYSGVEHNNPKEHTECFYETISDDGSRIAVWKLAAQRYQLQNPFLLFISYSTNIAIAMI